MYFCWQTSTISEYLPIWTAIIRTPDSCCKIRTQLEVVKIWAARWTLSNPAQNVVVNNRTDFTNASKVVVINRCLFGQKDWEDENGWFWIKKTIWWLSGSCLIITWSWQKKFDRSRRREQKHSELLVSSYIGSEYVFGSVPSYCNIT